MERNILLYKSRYYYKYLHQRHLKKLLNEVVLSTVMRYRTGNREMDNKDIHKFFDIANNYFKGVKPQLPSSVQSEHRVYWRWLCKNATSCRDKALYEKMQEQRYEDAKDTLRLAITKIKKRRTTDMFSEEIDNRIRISMNDLNRVLPWIGIYGLFSRLFLY